MAEATLDVGTEAPDESPVVQLPPEAKAWTRLEADLFRLSRGAYHPGEMAARRRLPRRNAAARGTGASQEVPGRVSIVSPTMSSRQHYHEQLWACFEAQDWADKELVVVESYTTNPSAFLQEKAKTDSRLVHVCFKIEEGEDFSVGLKRNMTMHLASGWMICNFDDDDIYAANYVTEMAREMMSKDLVALTLSSWYNYIVPRRVCAYSDPAKSEDLEGEELDEVLYGYGFSYFHKRREALAHPYPDVVFAEDAPFLMALRDTFGDDRVLLRRDEEGLCMHIVHRGNSTGVQGESLTHELSQAETDALSVSDLPVFRQFLDMHSTSWWRLLPFASWGLGLLAARQSGATRRAKLACV